MSAVLLPRNRWRYLEGQFEINARIKAQARIRDAFLEYAD